MCAGLKCILVTSGAYPMIEKNNIKFENQIGRQNFKILLIIKAMNVDFFDLFPLYQNDE
jgi:hypothetical protein